MLARKYSHKLAIQASRAKIPCIMIIRKKKTETLKMMEAAKNGSTVTVYRT